MFVETTAVTPHDVESTSPEASAEMAALIAEIGATYPLVAYTVQAGEPDETEAMNAAILAGLVAP